jgi:RNA polymerase sigma factor (sigma-70 family)
VAESERNPPAGRGVSGAVEDRPLPERELVLRAQGGDPRAFEELVRMHQRIAFRVAYLVAGATAEAEDAAQEGFVKAWHALGRFRSDAPFRPWLLRIVANEARNRRRSAGRRAELVVRAGRQGVPGDAALSPEADAVAGSERERLLAAVHALPHDARVVIECRYFLELSERETAEALDLRLGTVKSRTARALERLRESYV